MAEHRTSPLGLIAGAGELPYCVARQAMDSGRGVCVVGLSGMADAVLLKDFSGVSAGLGEVGKILGTLRQAGCRDVVLAGLVKRPDFSALALDKAFLGWLPGIVAAACKGDTALLKKIADLMENEGFRIQSVQEAAPFLKIGPGGFRKNLAPGKQHWPDIRKAAKIAGEMGRLDIGQAVIVCDGLVLCVEAQEGTQKMLKRCADLPTAIRGSASARKGVLLKAPKTIQDRRTDMPVIGLRTVLDVAEAGLAGIALEAEGALVLNSEAVAEAAQRLGLFICGYSPDQL